MSNLPSLQKFASKTAAHTDRSALRFYDIESLHNIFTAVFMDYDRDGNHAFRVYCLADEPHLIQTDAIINDIVIKNPTYQIDPNKVTVYPLPSKHSNDDGELHPAWEAFIDDCGGRTSSSNLHANKNGMIVTDANITYDDTKHPFIFGYNSMGYDLPVIAYILVHIGATDRDAYCAESTISPSDIRSFSDAIINSPRTKRLRDIAKDELGDNDGSILSGVVYGYNQSGRHIDITRLNERQSHVALKRMMGQMGHQILESDRLSDHNAQVETVADVAELCAYNVSDVIGTQLLFHEPTYASSFNLRSSLLHTYPELVFDVTKNNDNKVKSYRLTINSSSAQFAANILSPFGALEDIEHHNADTPVVTFRYPAEEVARKKGLERKNTLTRARDYFFSVIDDHDARAQFKEVYDFYRDIEGRNFNHNLNKTVHDTTLAVRSQLIETALAIEKQRHNLDKTHYAMYTKAINRLDQFTRHSRTDNFIDQWAQGSIMGEVQRCVHNNANIDAALAVKARGSTREPLTATITGWMSIGKMLMYMADVDKRYNTINPNPDVYTAAKDCYATIVNALIDAQEPYWDDERQRWDNEWIDEHGLCHPATKHTVEITVPNARMYPTVDDPQQPQGKPALLGDVPKRPLNIPYFSDASGTPSSGFATFSTGGIHGAEYNKDLYEYERAQNEQQQQAFDDCVNFVIDTYRTACETTPHDTIVTGARAYAAEVINDPTKAEKFPELYDRNGNPIDHATQAGSAYFFRHHITLDHPTLGEIHQKDYLAAGAGIRKSNPRWRAITKGVKKNTPQLFIPVNSKKATIDNIAHNANKLSDRYAFTSVDVTIHEDFKSYYPLMLTNMAAFTNPQLPKNPDGTVADRYVDMFFQKEDFGAKMKDPSLSPEQRAAYAVMREGTKLVLNSASGAGDAQHDTNIRMNNTIIAMRVNGQLFSWQIGQAQTLAGGRIVSTNTDGLYSVLDERTNNAILAEQTKDIAVDIEPEELILVSKDSNNRVEFASTRGESVFDRTVYAASGGSLSCFNGPSPVSSLSHPAIVDRILVDYFKYIIDQGVERIDGKSAAAWYMQQPFDRSIGHSIINHLHELYADDPATLLTFYQNIVSASTSSYTYPYSVPFADDGGNVVAATERHRVAEATLMQRYSRVFIANVDAARARGIGLRQVATVKAKTISSAVLARREKMQREFKDGALPQADEYEKDIVGLLNKANPYINCAQLGREPAVEVLTGISPTTPLIIANHAMHLQHPNDEHTAMLRKLLDIIDVDAYLDMAEKSFNTLWRNIVPQ